MDNSDNNSKDTETVLMALDQISQTIDVMTSVVSRLRAYLEQHALESKPDKTTALQAEMQSDRVLH